MRTCVIDKPKLTTRVYRGTEEICRIQEEWYDLAETLETAGITQYPEYTLAYMQAFKDADQQTTVIAVFDQERLVAIFPCRLVTRRVAGISVRTIEFPQYPLPVRDALICPSASGSEVLQAFVSSIRSSIGSTWDYVQFRGVLESSALMNLVEGYRHASAFHYDYSHLLTVDTNDYIQTVLNSKARNNLRRNRKKLAGLGEFEFRTFTAFPELEDAYREFLRTEAAGWKSIKGGKRAIALHEDQSRFYLDLLKRHSKAGRSHIHILYLNGEAIASDLCILTANSCYSLKHGYDEEYSNLAPGNLLRQYAVEYYGQSSVINSIDLVSGLDWHLTWRPERRKVFDVRFFNSSVRGIFLFYLLRARHTSRHLSDQE